MSFATPRSAGAGRAVTFRAYTPRDFETCMDVFDTNVPRYFAPEERTEYARFLRSLPGPYFLAVADSGVVVGCGGYAVGEGSGVADLCWGMIRHDLQGRGFGRALTRMRIREARSDARVNEVALRTSQDTAGFYEHLGFRTTRVIQDGIAPGVDRYDMVLRSDP